MLHSWMGFQPTIRTCSKDGQWIAYDSYPDGVLWRSRVDGSDRLRLAIRATILSCDASVVSGRPENCILRTSFRANKARFTRYS